MDDNDNENIIVQTAFNVTLVCGDSGPGAPQFRCVIQHILGIEGAGS